MLLCEACQEKPKMFVNYCCGYGSFQNKDHENCIGEYQSNKEGKDWKPKALIKLANWQQVGK